MEKELIKKEKNRSEFLFRIIAGSLFVLSWIVLGGIKATSDISLKPFTIISIVLTVVFAISIFGRKMYELTQRLKESEKEIKPLTEDEVEEIEKKIINKMWNYIEKGQVSKRKTNDINNNIIYENHVKLYREIEFGENQTDEIIILINATHKDIHPTILPNNCGKEELRDSINRLARGYSAPDIEEAIIEADALGRPVQRTKKISYNKPKKEEKESVV